jgi:hypothetical protein
MAPPLHMGEKDLPSRSPHVDQFLTRQINNLVTRHTRALRSPCIYAQPLISAYLIQEKGGRCGGGAGAPGGGGGGGRQEEGGGDGGGRQEAGGGAGGRGQEAGGGEGCQHLE